MSDRRSGKNLIIPIFIPNQGCSHQCIYCQQEKITGQSKIPVNESYIKQRLDRAVESVKYISSSKREVAFYGGTFTSLRLSRMIELLEAVKPYLNKQIFSSIRVSTRPDEIDRKKLALLKDFGVSTVELGVQSMDDDILRRSQRGHNADDTIKSVGLLKQYGFKVGVQLMPGLPGDSEEKFRRTIEKITGLQPDMARLYPVIVIKGTKLAKWYHEKRYQPLTLEEAIKICHESCVSLENRGITVIRIGLMSSPSLLQGQILAGPWHSAFGFLVRSSIYQNNIEPFLPKHGQASKIGIMAPSREIPLIRGYRNQGLRLMEKKSGAKIVYVKPDDTVPEGRIDVEVIC